MGAKADFFWFQSQEILNLIQLTSYQHEKQIPGQFYGPRSLTSIHLLSFLKSV